MIFLTAIFLSLQIIFAHSKVIPDYAPQPCPISATDYNECMRQFFSKLLTGYPTTGIPELHVPSIKPFVLPVTSVNTTISNAASIEATFTNFRADGLENLQLKDFKLDLETMTGEVEMFIPYLRGTTEYKGAIKLLTPISFVNSGYSKGSVINLLLHFKFKLKPIEKSGIKYVTIEDYDVNGSIESVNLKLEGKTLEEKRIANIIEEIFNNNPKDILDTFKPVFNNFGGVIFKMLFGTIIETIPAKELFPGISL